MANGNETGGGHVLNFQDWQEQYQTDQNVVRKDIQELTASVAEVAATVRQLTENQKGIFSRIGRPFQWGAFVSALVGVAIFIGMALAPMQKESDRQYHYDIADTRQALKDAESDAVVETNQQWLMKMEERSYQRAQRIDVTVHRNGGDHDHN